MHLILRFFDVEAYIQSDSRAYLNRFSQMYGNFQPTDASGPTQSKVEYAILTKPNNTWGQPVIILAGEVWPLHNPKLVKDYLYDVVLNSIVTKIRSHFLIHAGVIAHEGQGVILAADSGYGKTTLVLELVRRGFKFLSDDVAALGWADHRVHPFPRSLRIRPETLHLTGFPVVVTGKPVWSDKYILDIDQIQPSSLGQAVAINHIIILQDSAEGEGERLDGSERELGIVVDRLDASLLTAIRQLNGVTEIHSGIEHGYPIIRLRAIQRMAILARIEALCQERQVLILDIRKWTETKPNFDTPAHLDQIPTSQAVLELLRRFQGGHHSALLQKEFGGSSSQLFMELAALLDQANCYRLNVGPLQQTADLVCDLVGF